MSDALLAAVEIGFRSYDLAREYVPGMPQSPNHPVYAHALQRRHGDMRRPDGGSASNDLIVLGTHVGTHIDALAHVSHDGLLHGGLDAAQNQLGGRHRELGVDAVPPLVTRGILLDVPAALGLESCAPGYLITPADLDRCVERQGIAPRAGDVLLVRSGWARRWHDGTAYIGRDSGVPGVGEEGARWLAARRPAAVGADTIAFECLPPGAGHAELPAHRVLLVEAGINIIETMNLEPLAADGVVEFTFVAVPLPLVGATGSPIRPLALVGNAL